jgi:hypothetical protein
MAADVCAGHLQAVDVAKRTTEVAGVKRGSRMCSSLEAAAAWGRSRANKWSVVSERPAHTEAPSSSARPQFHGEQRPIPNRDGVEASAESGGVSSTATTSPPFATSTSTSTSTTTRTRVHNRLGEGQTISFADACPPSVRVHKFLLLLSLYLFLFFAHTGAATEPCSVRVCKLLLMRPLCLFLFFIMQEQPGSTRSSDDGCATDPHMYDEMSDMYYFVYDFVWSTNSIQFSSFI